MKTLALEMSTAQGSIAWREDGEALFDGRFAADRKHSGAFFENVQQCLERFGRPEKIIVGLGPGSYAGVRIVIATALGLRSATNAKLAGIPSVCALDVETANYCVIGDARRQTFFLATIEGGQLTEGPVLQTLAKLEAKLGEVTRPVYTFERLSQFPIAKLAYPSAGRLVEIARLYPDDIDGALEPIYLREPHITAAKVMPGFARMK